MSVDDDDDDDGISRADPAIKCASPQPLSLNCHGISYPEMV